MVTESSLVTSRNWHLSWPQYGQNICFEYVGNATVIWTIVGWFNSDEQSVSIVSHWSLTCMYAPVVWPTQTLPIGQYTVGQPQSTWYIPTFKCDVNDIWRCGHVHVGTPCDDLFKLPFPDVWQPLPDGDKRNANCQQIVRGWLVWYDIYVGWSNNSTTNLNMSVTHNWRRWLNCAFSYTKTYTFLCAPQWLPSMMTPPNYLQLLIISMLSTQTAY